RGRRGRARPARAARRRSGRAAAASATARAPRPAPGRSRGRACARHSSGARPGTTPRRAAPGGRARARRARASAPRRTSRSTTRTHRDPRPTSARGRRSRRSEARAAPRASGGSDRAPCARARPAEASRAPPRRRSPRSYASLAGGGSRRALLGRGLVARARPDGLARVLRGDRRVPAAEVRLAAAAGNEPDGRARAAEGHGVHLAPRYGGGVASVGAWPSESRGPAQPRLAATVVLLREERGRLEALLVRRGADLRYLGGAWVFPGGALDEADCAEEILAGIPHDVRERCRRRLAGSGEPPGAAAALGLFVAACRETFEECGVVLARRADGSAYVPDGRPAARER